MKINIEKVVIKNFLSFGNKPSIFELNTGLNLITGIDKDSSRINGVGKCLDKSSLIDIKGIDEETEELLKEFISK